MHPKRKYKERRRLRLERMVVGNRHRSFQDARANNNPEFHNNSNPRINYVDDAEAEYTTANNFFIAGAIEAVRKGYQNTTDCIEFITTNVKEQLFWLRIYRYLFIIEKIIFIINIIWQMMMK